MSESSILRNFPQWEKLRDKLSEDVENEALWSELIAHHEKLISDHYQLLKSRNELKSLVYGDLEQITAKYPYYEKYWKKYVSMVYQIDGAVESIRILERAILVCPYSLDIWNNYLQQLTDGTLSSGRKTEQEMRTIFERGSDTIGYHYTSDKFWDLYLDWAKSTYGTNSNEFIRILIKALKIPQYQYAKYNDMFNGLKGNFEVFDLVDRDNMIKFIKRQNENHEIDMESIDDYIYTHSATLIDSYFGDVLDYVQRRAQDKWKYESEVKSEFGFELTTDSDIQKWNAYLDYEEEAKKSSAYYTELELVSVYERALIPTCSDDRVWMRYLRHLIHSDAKQYKVISIFNKACDHFVPFELKDLRYMYIKYLQLKLNKISSCKEVFLSMVKKTPTDPEIVSRFVQFLLDTCDTDSKETLLLDLLNVVHKYNDENTVDVKAVKKRKKTMENTNNQDRALKNEGIESSVLIKLYKELNLWTVGQLVVNVANHYWKVEKNITKTRDILMTFFKTEAVKSSKAFWFFFFKFEKCQRNKKNLTSMIEYITIKSKLFPKDINFLFNEYNQFAFKNFTVADIKSHQRNLIKNFLEIDVESSLHEKHYMKLRLSHDNDDEDSVNKRIFKENGHPSAVREGLPTLINPIDFKTGTFNKEAFPLPRFRNVQKANLNVKYIHESI